MNDRKDKNYFYAALIITVFLCMICPSAFSTEYSIDGVFFNKKMPSKRDALVESLTNYKDSVAVLRNNAGAINSLKKSDSIKIVGHTETTECLGLECERLSLRRAQLIYKWMLANGVPKDRFLSPEGHGSSEPMENNETSEGQARNRYVEFEVISAPSTP